LEVVAALRTKTEAPTFEVKPYRLSVPDFGVRIKAQDKKRHHGIEQGVFA